MAGVLGKGVAELLTALAGYIEQEKQNIVSFVAPKVDQGLDAVSADLQSLVAKGKWAFLYQAAVDSVIQNLDAQAKALVTSDLPGFLDQVVAALKNEAAALAA